MVNFEATTEIKSISSDLKLYRIRRLNTKTKLISIHTLRPSISLPPPNKQVNSDLLHSSQANFDPRYEIKSIMTPRHQKQFYFDPYTTYLPPPDYNQVNFDPFTEIRSRSIPHINQVNFDLNAITKPFSTHHKQQVNFNPHTETKLLSIERLKPRLFRPPHQNQVNSDPILKSRQVQSPALKSSQYRCSPLNQAICGPHPNTESISTTPAHTKTMLVDHT